MEIRYLSSVDSLAEIGKIYEESWKHAYSNIVPQEYLKSIPGESWVMLLNKPDWYTMVCIEGEKYIGTSGFGRSRFDEYADEGEIITLHLLPEYVGKGYGTQLLYSVLNELKNLGYDTAFVWAFEENKKAREFYEKRGFECTNDFLDECIGGRTIREIRYIYRFNK